MKTFPYAERAARLLRSARARIRPHSSAASGVTIALLAEAIAGAASRRRRHRVTAAAGAGALALGVVAVMVSSPWKLPRPDAPESQVIALAGRPQLVAGNSTSATMTTAGGEAQSLVPGHAWLPEERLRSEALALILTAADGTTIDLQPWSELKLLRADAERWLRLGSGAVSVHVAKLTEGERFVILTPDAEVEVRGTRFHVALVPAADDCGHGTPTRVVVDEGVVVVRSSQGEVRVEAGKSWPAGCSSSQVAPSSSRSIRAVASAKRSSKGLPAIQNADRNDGASSTLATENDLFSAALKAERLGDRRAATQLLDVLVARFPKSPLKESAERARTRLTGSDQPTP